MSAARRGSVGAGAFVILACLAAPGWAAAEMAADAPKIKVTPVPRETLPMPLLVAAYDAFRAGDYDGAAKLYERALLSEPRNVDALLGQAAVAVHRGELDRARESYLAVLHLEPANAVAQGALLAWFGRADYAAAELRLKELASRQPSAFLFQSLGTLYAEQGLWPQAQQAYFQAHHLDPRNADHAYNLAVALDHLGQRAAAATYYRRAVELAGTGAAPSFAVAQAADRAARIAAAE